MKKFIKIFSEIFISSLLFIFIFSGNLWSLGMELNSPLPGIDLGYFSPGQRKYLQPSECVIITVDNSSDSHGFVVKILNSNTPPKGLVLEGNPDFYVECSDSKPNFVYHATASSSTPPVTATRGGYLANDKGVLKPGVEYLVYQGAAYENLTITFYFDLFMPFKINDQITPFGKYSTTVIISVIQNT